MSLADPIYKPPEGMPTYECSKRVRALKIGVVWRIATTGEGHIRPADEDFDMFTVSKDYLDRYCPEVGGYYCVGESGDASYLSAAEFEVYFSRAEAQELIA